MSKRILFAAAALVLFASGLFVRWGNSGEAKRQADAIAAADVAGGDGASQLAGLKLYVAGHMGASVTVTQQGSYNQAVAAAKASAAAPDPNAKVYAAAQAACAGKSDSVTQAKCNQTYVSQHLSTAATPVPVAAPVLANYQTKLKSPLWTPDLAGALLLGAVVAFGLTIPALRRKR